MNELSDLTALRLYLPQSARAKPTRFWHHLSAPVLSHRLLHAARHAGIRQALLHSVHAGYLQGQKPTHHHVEASASHHPLCLELIDSEATLRAYLAAHADELKGVQAVFFRCELAR
ncbi:hypothetical protein [Niveibacterium sp.]|uniref:hypothetical protein n=1 Tax=Niveibacterium sp. TaxID=2017444 RepID=UPI0035AFBA34